MPIFEAILHEVTATRKYDGITPGVCDDSSHQLRSNFTLIDKVLFQENIRNIR